MKTIKPTYYDQFKCIAGECEFTCCREWNINVDEETQDKWKQLNPDYLTHVCSTWAGPAIALKEDGFCPFFNDQGLCKIVLEHGEDCISKTCHTFPREIHEFSDRVEYTLAMGCPAALDLLWKQEAFETKGDTIELLKLLASLKKPSLIIPSIHLALLDLYEQGEDDISYDRLKEQLTKEVLDELCQALCQVKREEYDHIMEQNELFLDLAENYRKKGIYADLLEPIAKKAESFTDPQTEQEFLKKRKDFEPLWEGFCKEELLLLMEELYSTLILPDSDLYMSILKIQWIGIFFAVLKQMAFLTWCMKGAISQADLKQIVVVLVRMTGYTDEDIEEYLENSFEEAIWDWGYMALII